MITYFKKKTLFTMNKEQVNAIKVKKIFSCHILISFSKLLQIYNNRY